MCLYEYVDTCGKSEEEGEGKRRRLSPVAWHAASLLLGHTCCISSFEMRDYREPAREAVLRETKETNEK